MHFIRFQPLVRFQSIVRFQSVVIALFLAMPAAASAQPESTDSPAKLRICTQNLFRFGEKTSDIPPPPKWKNGKPPRKKLPKHTISRSEQRDYLAARFEEAKCDVVALQEVIGKNDSQALANTLTLASAWQKLNGEHIEPVIGVTHEGVIRNGFLVRTSAAKVIARDSAFREPLPSIQPLGPTARFLRGPLGILLETKRGRPQQVYLLNFHLKSRARGFRDPSGTEYELLRMEMASAIRTMVVRASNENPNIAYVVLGDRNSDRGSGAASILSGEHTLEDFRLNGGCRLDKEEAAVCETVEARSPELIGLLETSSKGRMRGAGATFAFRGKEQQLDEIYVRPGRVASAQDPQGRFRIGLTGDYVRGSDHKLLWSEFRF